MTGRARDHGGGIDAAIAQHGGTRAGWLDLSTGINPVPYPLPELSQDAWTALPDDRANARLVAAARAFWAVPAGAAVLPAPGTSALIARMPALSDHFSAYIPGPTYNEHAAAFRAHGQLGTGTDPESGVHVYVHPNNPDGRLWPASAIGGRQLTVIDESFCDTCPDESHVGRAAGEGVVVLKSFGKFWGLAGLRLGFAIGLPDTLSPRQRDAGGNWSTIVELAELLGPWPVSGPALTIGAQALADHDWANTTRARLARDATRLDVLMQSRGATVLGGTTLFRLYEVDDASLWQDRLARAHVWSRVFPYSRRWLRLGLPAPDRWAQIEAAL